MPFAETARAPYARFARRSPTAPRKRRRASAYAGSTRLALTPADILRLKQKGMLCVRSPKTAHTRRSARRITCLLFHRRHAAPALVAALKAAGPPQNVASAGKGRDATAFRAALSGFVHARRFSFWLPPPWAFGPRRGPARWSRLRARPCRPHRLRRSAERRRSSRASGSRYSPESRHHRSPYSLAAACRCRRGRRHRHAAASGLRSGKHRAGKAVTLLAGRSARRPESFAPCSLLKPGRKWGLQKRTFPFR